jgi:hypothetical protein
LKREDQPAPPVIWVCCCGFESEDANLAFLHRTGDSAHHVVPVLESELRKDRCQ